MDGASQREEPHSDISFWTKERDRKQLPSRVEGSGCPCRSSRMRHFEFGPFEIGSGGADSEYASDQRMRSIIDAVEGGQNVCALEKLLLIIHRTPSSIK
jgi:hypothetical protein